MTILSVFIMYPIKSLLINSLTPMNKLNKVLIVSILVFSCGFGFTGAHVANAVSPATVDLGTALNFVILSKTGISTTGSTVITGDIGVSPIAASAITGFALILPTASAFSTSNLVTGKVYASDYASPTPASLTTAVLDMQTAYTDAMGRASTVTELGAGNIGGLTLASGVYKWGTGLAIPTDVTLSGSANDIWIFQIAQNLNLSSAAKIILAGGAKASNIFWVVAGQTTIGTTAVFNGNILDQTAIVLNTGAVFNGRALAQTAVTLDSNTVTLSTVSPATPATPAVPTVTPAIPATPATGTTPPASPSSEAPTPPRPSLPVACTMEAMQCPDGSYVSRHGPDCAFATCPAVAIHTPVVIVEPSSTPENPVRTITINLVKGSRGEMVKILQEFLIAQDKGVASQALAKVGATAYFGPLTQKALAEFQLSVGVKPAWGNFGPITRAYLSAQY